MPTLKRSRIDAEIGTPALARLMRRGWIDSDPAILAAWSRHDADQNAADFKLLVEHYSPVVLHIAASLKKFHPDFYCGELDEMLSDGFVALITSVRWAARTEGVTSGMRVYWMRKRIRTEIRRGRLRQMFRRASEGNRDLIISRIRGTMVAELGRLPNPDEMTAALTPLITNPNIHFTPSRRPTKSIDAEPADGSPALSSTIVGREGEPFQAMMNSELMKLALKGMTPIDKKLFRRIMRGDFPSDMAREFGVSRQRMNQRVNGLLWNLRTRGDLCLHLGVQAEKPIPRNQRHFAIKQTAMRRVG